VKKIISAACLIYLCVLTNQPVQADIAGLVPCRDSAVFNKRLQNSVKKIETRLAQYSPKTPPALALESQIERTKSRFNRYEQAGLLCGSDGLPHLITDGRWSHAGDFIFPGLLFLYITGWIGWVGRGYLQTVAGMNKPTEKEIIIDVPLAMKFSVSGFTWPLAAWQEFTSGNLTENDNNITVSPR